MNRKRDIAAIVAAMSLVMPLATVATDVEPEASPAPLGPPVVYEDPVGDVTTGGPDLLSCSVSEPAESLVSFRFEFANDPPLSYDLDTWSTDQLFLGLATTPEATFPDDFEYILIVHGATLPQEVETGSNLYDGTRPEGDEVLWRVVDADVDGAVVTLTVDRKLIGDPDVILFYVGVSTEGQEETVEHDICPDEDAGPGEYQLYG